ncbi:16S rRNA (cytosine(1402)-N(4))-methyltransferase RsmH [Desulfoprunum benzoelyticum]|uniref:Ribosomal RNA small subunit methyltransferase H n=1 Tax=Desulfoprunum benzoelyticum TaxID=1506996 RepID=A0A840US14_9BACT|nr:16S rRNA (cytosine(1402)-N(4))-methyltransferase RsmH [Desulfoprunum benzoelyticum]MBB5347616.1 16S rRNA (cytosine1402-N4)-methyltransferase [Desulfoprunum benzoelyticum]MBM9529255.1 16S rRNA (cytosine(1402)-N(4))-methyltransferase RsmH [Desulfoprunum benzoelyticum]
MGVEAAIEEIHRSVLVDEILRYLDPVPGGVYVDGTLGLGGHTEALLSRSAPDGRVIAFEWDEAAIELSRKRLRDFGTRLTIIRSNFAEIVSGLKGLGIDRVDGVLIDIGLSSLQLDRGERGFSFQRDEPLDMRMDIRQDTTAASLLASCSEEQLADIFFYFGDEYQARPIAAEIARAREKEPIRTTRQLAALVAAAVPRRFHPKKIHVATKVFQALRIAVNTELENLARILDEAVPLLNTGARFCVISFHSLEDRIVKRKFRQNKELEVLTAKPVMPRAEEIAENPRSRSARLRAACKRAEQ